MMRSVRCLRADSPVQANARQHVQGFDGGLHCWLATTKRHGKLSTYSPMTTLALGAG